jgi:hypothetical protein
VLASRRTQAVFPFTMEGPEIDSPTPMATETAAPGSEEALRSAAIEAGAELVREMRRAIKAGDQAKVDELLKKHPALLDTRDPDNQGVGDDDIVGGVAARCSKIYTSLCWEAWPSAGQS